jgi:hypothetical protein
MAFAACSARLEQVLGHVDADEGGRAPHAGQVVSQHVAPHFEVVDQHGGHAGRRREAAARHDHDVDLRAWRVACVTRAHQAGRRGAKQPPHSLLSMHTLTLPPTRCASCTHASHACRLKASLRHESRRAPAQVPLQCGTAAGAGDLAAAAASLARHKRGRAPQEWDAGPPRHTVRCGAGCRTPASPLSQQRLPQRSSKPPPPGNSG